MGGSDRLRDTLSCAGAIGDAIVEAAPSSGFRLMVTTEKSWGLAVIKDKARHGGMINRCTAVVHLGLGARLCSTLVWAS